MSEELIGAEYLKGNANMLELGRWNREGCTATSAATKEKARQRDKYCAKMYIRVKVR